MSEMQQHGSRYFGSLKQGHAGKTSWKISISFYADHFGRFHQLKHKFLCN